MHVRDIPLEKRWRVSVAVSLFLLASGTVQAWSADKLIGIHSARVLSQAMPWIAQDAGLFKKYNWTFPWYLSLRPLP
jgi:hypothetical protein